MSESVQLTARPDGERHHAGGKSTFPMMPGVIGDAYFTGERLEHRIWLSREDANHLSCEGYALFAGMNPSTANHLMDDLTVRKDQVFANQHGLHKIYKVNAGSYCATNPDDLTAYAKAGGQISHLLNLPMIRELAARASLIVMTTGKPPELLKPFAEEMFNQLKADGREMYCLGLTKDGWPKHSSRLAYATPFERFRV